MFHHTFQGLPGEIESLKGSMAAFKLCQQSYRVGIMVKATIGCHAFLKDILARMPERRMTQIMGKGDTLGEVFIQLKSPRE